MSKQLAIITDVHGNSPALRAALAEIDHLYTVDHIYCLGDMIGIGPDSNEVLEQLFDREDVSMITGNHDEAVLALLKGREYPTSHTHVREHHEWIAKRLDSTYISRLEALPRMLSAEVEGHSALFIHYHIDKELIAAPIAQDPFSSIVEPKLDELERLFAGYEFDLISFGHHHPVHYIQSANRIYLNPGSLGCYDKPFARYAIVLISQQGIHIELKAAAYDNTAFLASYAKFEVPDREFILKIFHGNQTGI